MLPDSIPVPNTPRGIYGYRPDNAAITYLRMDHCQYTKDTYVLSTRYPGEHGRQIGRTFEFQNGSVCVNGTVESPLGTPRPEHRTCFAIPPEGQLNRLGQNESEALAACQERCTSSRGIDFPWRGLGYCYAVNIVPMAIPPEVLFPEDQNIPWGVNDCTRECFENEPVGTRICYGVRESPDYRRAVEAPWEIAADDPTDEVFYSTCFRKNDVWAFDGQPCGDDCITPRSTPAWRFGERCLTCDDAERWTTWIFHSS